MLEADAANTDTPRVASVSAFLFKNAIEATRCVPSGLKATWLPRGSKNRRSFSRSSRLASSNLYLTGAF